MKDKAIKRIALGGILAAATILLTTLVSIPIPGGLGFVNLGDAGVLTAAFLLGGPWGALCGGAASALSDLLLGYGHYAPATFLIKGGVALIACLLLRMFYKKGQEPSILRLVCCTVPAEVFMALGYFVYKATVLGAGIGAAAGIPADLMQGLMGVIISVVLFRLLYRVPALRERFWKG